MTPKNPSAPEFFMDPERHHPDDEPEERQDAGAVFRQHVGGSNFMTPNVIRYGWTGAHAYELSEGRGMDGERLYGVTVADLDRRRNDLSRACFSRAQAEDYIRELSEID